MPQENDFDRPKLAKLDANKDIQIEELKNDKLLLKKSVLDLEKKILKNQELRLKYSEEPSRFMESECDLYYDLQNFLNISSDTENYSILIKLNVIDSFFELLTHQNTDLSVCVLQILIDMTSTEDMEEHSKEFMELFDVLNSRNIFSVVYHLLLRFQEEKEFESCLYCFNIIDNIVEVDCEIIFKNSDLIGDLIVFLLNFIQNTEVTNISLKLHASEITSVIVQNDKNNNKIFNDKNGIKLTLMCLQTYKKNDPSTMDERELMENLFDIICASFIHSEGKMLFYENDGIKFMIEVLKSKKKSCFGAIKLFSFMFSGHKIDADYIKSFIDNLGLRYFFPLFLKTLKKNSSMSKNEYDEHFCTIINALLKFSSGVHKQRVVHKFIESEFIKTDRLLELYSTYDTLVNKNTKALNEKLKTQDWNNSEESIYLEKLNFGLYTLQLICLSIIDLLALGIEELTERIKSYFYQNSINIVRVISVIEDYLEYLSSGVDSNNQAVITEKNRIKNCLNRVKTF